MELISIKEIPLDSRVLLLKELDFGVDNEGYVIDKKLERVKDKYIGIEVRVNNMIIAPGSILILDDNPVSIASYSN